MMGKWQEKNPGLTKSAREVEVGGEPEDLNSFLEIGEFTQKPCCD